MSFYSPKITFPVNAGEVIASVGNNFTWEISGTESQVKYQIYVRRVSDNVLVYDSGLVTSSSTSHTVPSSTFTVNILYKWMIDSYNAPAAKTTSKYQLFTAIGTPTLVLSATPSVDQNFTFSYLYTHPQNITVKSFEMLLYEDSMLIDESGVVYPATLTYSGDTINYAFTGLISGSNYSIKCMCLTQNDYEINSVVTNFVVNYTYPEQSPYFTATPINSNGSVYLSWEDMILLIGQVTNGTYEYVSGKYNLGVHLSDGAELYYTRSFPEYFTMGFWIKLPLTFAGDIFKIDDKFYFGYNGNKFYYKNNNRITAGVARNLLNEWFWVGFKPSELIIVTSGYTEYLR